MMKSQQKVGALTAAVLALGSLGSVASAAPFTNGSFESELQSGPTRVDISNLTDWTSIGGSNLLEQGVNGTSNIAAAAGVQFVSMGHNGATGSQLYQDFDTLIGQLYQVDFQVRSIQGTGTNQTLTARAFADTDLVNPLSSTVTPVENTSAWAAGNTLIFTAITTTSRLEFFDTEGSSANIALDAVTVIPEPATLATLAVGGLMMLRRRRVRPRPDGRRHTPA